MKGIMSMEIPADAASNTNDSSTGLVHNMFVLF
jgi:hypothetical protein